MKNEIVKVDPKEFGLTDETAKNIRAQFEPMLKKMEELEDEFNKIVKMPIDDIDTVLAAKELRKKYVKVRTGTAEIHKQQKSFYLNGGRFVDGWKNAQIFASAGKEEALEAIEKHRENMEIERIRVLCFERKEALRLYVEDVDSLTINFGAMESDVWDAYLSAKIKEHKELVEAEEEAKRLEELRLEAERLEAEKQRVENERLKAEVAAREKIRAERSKVLQPYLMFTRDYNETLDLSEEDFKAILVIVKMTAELQWAKDKKTADEAAKEKAAAEAKLKKEREEADRLRKELEEQKRLADLEQKRLADLEQKRLADLEAAKAAPDFEKMMILAERIAKTELPAVESEEAKRVLANVQALLNKIHDYIVSKC